MRNLVLYVTMESDGHLDLFRKTKTYSRHIESVSFHNPLDIDCMVWFEDSTTFGVKAIGLAAQSDYSLKVKRQDSKTPYRVSELREQKAERMARSASVPQTPTVPPGKDPPSGT
jgi:hypothetical protein